MENMDENSKQHLPTAIIVGSLSVLKALLQRLLPGRRRENSPRRCDVDFFSTCRFRGGEGVILLGCI